MQARGQTIRRKREECGYRLRDFARRIGVSASYLSRIERDQIKNPSPDVLKRIALGLDAEGAASARAAISKIAQHETEGSDDDNPAG